MDFQEVIRRRRMVRAFEERSIPASIVERILANAQRGPSAGFSQGFEFLIFDGADETRRYWDTAYAQGVWQRPAEHAGVYNARLLVVPCAHKAAYLDRYRELDKAAANRATAAGWPIPYWHIDTGFAALLMLLTAVDAGLGAVFFEPGDIPAFRAAFGVPESYEPIGVIAIGYAAPDRRSGSLRRGHRPAETVLHRGRW